MLGKIWQGGRKKGRRAGVRHGLQKGFRVRRSALRAANGDAEQARDEEGEREGGEIGAKILSPFRSSSESTFFAPRFFFSRRVFFGTAIRTWHTESPGLAKGEKKYLLAALEAIF